MSVGVYLKSTEVFLKSAFRQKCIRYALTPNTHTTDFDPRDHQAREQRCALQIFCKKECIKQHHTLSITDMGTS